jgi:hypothetical protein
MRTEVNCDNCGIQIGWYYTYGWGYYGQDPPETEYFNEDSIVISQNTDKVYCSYECWEEAEPPECPESAPEGEDAPQPQNGLSAS